MKKSLIIILIVFTLVITSSASAQVVGIYEMIASGSCIHSKLPFTKEIVNGLDHYVANGHSWGATTSAVGTWEFYLNGTGKADIWNYPIDYPPGSDSTTNYSGARARSQHLVYDTKWTRDKDVIVIKLYAPDTDPKFSTQRGELVGSVDVFKQTIIIPTILQQLALGDPLYYAVCNNMRTLIRVGGIK